MDAHIDRPLTRRYVRSGADTHVLFAVQTPNEMPCEKACRRPTHDIRHPVFLSDDTTSTHHRSDWISDERDPRCLMPQLS